jgi:hypothetical protein
MSQDLQELDDLFRAGLEGKAEAPPRSLWDAIEKRLDAPNPGSASPIPPKSPKPGLGWIKGLGGIALVGIIAASLLVSRKDAPMDGDRDSAVMKTMGGETYSATMEENESEQAQTNAIREEPRQKSEAFSQQESVVKDGSMTALPGQIPATQSMANPTRTGKTDIDGDKSAARGISAKSTLALPKVPGDSAHTAILKAEKSSEKSAVPLKTTVTSEQQTHSQFPRKVGETQGKNTTASRAAEEKGFEDQMMGNVMAKIQTGSPADAGSVTQNEKTKKTKADVRRDAQVFGARSNDSKKTSAVLELNGNNPMEAAGSSSPESLRPSPFLSRLSVTPMLAYNRTRIEVRENRSHQGRPGDDHRSFGETEQSGATVSPGMLVELRLTPSLSIQSGLVGLTNRLRIDEKDIKAVRDRDGSIRYRLDCSAGSYFIEPKQGTSPNAGDSIRIRSSEVSTKYIGIPLTLQLRGGKGRVRYFGTAGVDVNLLTGKQASAVFKGPSNKEVSPVRSEGLKSAFASGVVGGGLDVRLNKRMSVTVQPQYRFSLKKVNEGSRENAYPKTFSVMTGLKFDF